MCRKRLLRHLHRFKVHVCEYWRPCVENEQLDFCLLLGQLIPLRTLLSLFFFITLPADPPPTPYLTSVVSVFSPPTFSCLYCVIFSLYHCVLLLSLLSFSSFTSLRLFLHLSKIRQTLFCVMGAARKQKYHYPSDCHPDVSEILLGFYFGWGKKKAFAVPNIQWIVLILHNFLFIHLRQA